MADSPSRPQRLLDQLNHEFERLHTAKEDAFWTAHMGLTRTTGGSSSTPRGLHHAVARSPYVGAPATVGFHWIPLYLGMSWIKNSDRGHRA